jgi:hypothetical protein
VANFGREEMMGNTDFDKDQEQQGGQKQTPSDHSGRQGHGQGGSQPPQPDKDGNLRKEGSSDASHKVGPDKTGNR